MNRWKLIVVVAAVVFGGFLELFCLPGLHAQQTGARRNILTRQDLTDFPGHEGVVAQVEFAPGAHEPKHTHPGDIFGYVLEGALTVGVEGEPLVTAKPGEAFFVPRGKIHWGENAGNTRVKVVATFVVEKGKLLTSPVVQNTASEPPPSTEAQSCAALVEEQNPAYDVVIRNGHIIDGTGSPWYAGDIGIRNGRIAAIGNLSDAQAKQTIDAAGRVVSPGFIDMLGQSEETILVEPTVPSKIFQGITTEITGEGQTIAPLNDALLGELRSHFQPLFGQPPDWNWKSLAGYFARLQKQGLGINLGGYVGATNLRRTVVGDDDRAPTPEELERMKGLVAQAMREGAMGVSTALQYTPATFASTKELIALASVSAEYGGIYATHIRDQADNEMAALAEVAQIAREAHTAVEIFHLQVAGKANWGKMKQVVAFIEEARREGLDITADTYPYTAGANGLPSYLPPWVLAGGKVQAMGRLKNAAMRGRIRKDIETPSKDWENEWLEVAGPEDILIYPLGSSIAALRGKSVAEVAALWHEDPIDALLDIIIRDPDTWNIAFYKSQADVDLGLKQPWVSIGLDGGGMSPTGIFSKNGGHPRSFGTFSLVIRKYVQEEQALTLPEAIRKFSALPAQREHLSDRGVLKLGMWADIVIFDLAKVRDLATYENPNQLSQGMDYVLVNGVPVILDGKMTNALPGKVLYGPGYKGPR
jgi:dihydroorotase/N-acyl-D-amino-acid deacylase